MKQWILKIIARLLPAGLLAAILLTCVEVPQLSPVPDLLPEAKAREVAVEETETAEPETLIETVAPTPTPTAEVEQAEGNYTDGTYTGSANGYGGTISVQVTVEDGQITAVEILSASGETSSFFNRAKGVIDSILTKQTWEVDAISGATYSSNGIKGAVENALTGETVTTSTAPKTSSGNSAALKKVSYEEPTSGYKDGTYSGSATGFGGTITVSVTIAEGKITNIAITSAARETASFLSRASQVTASILSAQSPNVDTVSGATYSSNGIINAVKQALKSAAVDPDSVADEEPSETVTPTTEPSAEPSPEPSATPEPSESPCPSESPEPLPDNAEVVTETLTVTGSATVSPDAAMAFDAYPLTMTATVEKTTTTVPGEEGEEPTVTVCHKITALSVTPGTEDATNLVFMSLAESMVSQLQSCGTADTVSGATCSSRGILSAYQAVLAQLESDTEQTTETEAGE